MAGSLLVCVHAHTSMGASCDAQCNMVDSIIPSDSNPAVVNTISDCFIRVVYIISYYCKYF